LEQAGIFLLKAAECPTRSSHVREGANCRNLKSQKSFPLLDFSKSQQRIGKGGYIEMKISTQFVEKVSFVQKIFTDVEEEYDALLHLMTVTLDWGLEETVAVKNCFVGPVVYLGFGLRHWFAHPRTVSPHGERGFGNWPRSESCDVEGRRA
jgi:hypothetical protein